MILFSDVLWLCIFVCLFVCVFVCLWVCLFVCLSGAFDHEGVELGSQFLVGKLMGTEEGANDQEVSLSPSVRPSYLSTSIIIIMLTKGQN